MDVYHKILVKLYEESNGKPSEKVDLPALVKKEGFFPSFKDIYKHLNDQGWIIDVGRDMVCITPWGIKEAKKTSSGTVDNKRDLTRALNRLKAEAKEFLVMTEELLSNTDKDNLETVESKFDELKKTLGTVKENI